MDENIEYKIPETDGAPDQQQGESVVDNKQLPEKKNPLALLKHLDKRKILLPLGLVLVVLVAYKAIDFFDAKKAQRAEQQKAQMQDVASEPIAPIPQQPIYPAEPIIAETNSNSPDVGMLKQKIAKVETDIQQDKVRLNNLDNNVSAMQENIATIDKNIKQVSSILQQEITQVEQLRKLAYKPIKRHRASKKPSLIKYHIRALVPDQAWIESENGKYSRTVKVGDKLAGYGAVEYILYKEGMILMSNGAYIQYGENDN